MRPLLIVALLAVEIPLKSIYSTSPQEGMQRADWSNRIGSGRRNRIQIEFRSGASNVFLVDAESADDAILASRQVLMGYRSAERPAVTLDRTENYWLVVYLGFGGNRRWIVDSVTTDGNRIRFAYHRRPMPQGGEDGTLAPELYWIPLGELKPGKYRLELFDGEDVTLMRRVEVRAAQQ
jgi:hypothetical protein